MRYSYVHLFPYSTFQLNVGEDNLLAMTESEDGFVYVATGGQVAKLIKVRMALSILHAHASPS
jgi:hypothetical protein